MIDMGPSTEGNPFLLVILSSPGNLSKLDRLREVNLRISDPRGLAEAELRKLVDELSPRELDVLRMLRSDLSGPEIADEMLVSLNTVRTHTRNIYVKLGVSGKAARAAAAAHFSRT